MPTPAGRRPRRLLVLNERDLRNPLAGGAEVHVFQILSRLAERGDDITLLAATFPGCKREERCEGVRVLRLANRYLYYFVAPWMCARMTRREHYDLVIDVLNKLPFLSPWFAHTRCFAIVHHLFGSSAFRQVSLPIATATYLLEKLIPRAYRTTRMLAISESTRTDLIGRGLAADHIAVVPPGLDHSVYRPAGGGDAQPVVLWLGRLEPYKRADLMLRAMPRVLRAVPDARLVFVGAGSDRGALEALTKELDLSACVTFTGFVAEEEKVAWLQRSAVVVNTSEKEGWGLTVIEGNACGVPSVSSDVPGLRDSVRDGVTGILYPFGDQEALADAVIRVLSDRSLHARFRDAALVWAENFTWDAVIDEIDGMLKRECARGATAASP
jgi:glycosyltransferase involved in cell wall biosynthesis